MGVNGMKSGCNWLQTVRLALEKKVIYIPKGLAPGSILL